MGRGETLRPNLPLLDSVTAPEGCVSISQCVPLNPEACINIKFFVSTNRDELTNSFS